MTLKCNTYIYESITKKKRKEKISDIICSKEGGGMVVARQRGQHWVCMRMHWCANELVGGRVRDRQRQRK